MNREEIIKEHIAISVELDKLMDRLEELKQEKANILNGKYEGIEFVKAMQKSMEDYDNLLLEMKALKKKSDKLKKISN